MIALYPLLRGAAESFSGGFKEWPRLHGRRQVAGQKHGHAVGELNWGVFSVLVYLVETATVRRSELCKSPSSYGPTE